jgi:hypothetical protein
MNDRAIPLIAAAQTLGVALLIAALAHLATHMPPGPRPDQGPPRAPASIITPANPTANRP